MSKGDWKTNAFMINVVRICFKLHQNIMLKINQVWTFSFKNILSDNLPLVLCGQEVPVLPLCLIDPNDTKIKSHLTMK